MMKKAEIKKTLRRTREMSRQHPGIFYRVMDRPGGTPVITGSDWVYRERVLMGWNTLAVFRSGVRTGSEVAEA